MTESSEAAVLEVHDDRPAPVERPRRRDLAGLDGLRAIAVVLVILHHSAGQFTKGGIVHSIAEDGAFGVAIFFVLSGFLITYLLLREEADRGRVDLSKFYMRRMIRILPPAYVLTVVFVVMGALGWIAMTPSVLSSCLLFYRNYVEGPWVTGHLWTLAVEEHFYLIWPAIFILVRNPKLRVAVAAAAVAFGPMWKHFLMLRYGPTHLNWVRTDLRYDALLMGCLLALLTKLPKADAILGSRPFTNAFSGPILTALLFVTFSDRYQSIPGAKFAQASLQFLCVALLINLVVRAPDGWLSRVLDWPPIALIGRLSYSLYLWQQPFCVRAWPESASPFLRLPWNLIPILVCATLSYLLVERPLFRLRAKFRPH